MRPQVLGTVGFEIVSRQKLYMRVGVFEEFDMIQVWVQKR